MDNTFREISNQPESWALTIDSVAKAWPALGVSFETPGTHALFIGCGTSYYLAQSAARLFQEVTGIISLAVPASEVILTSQTIIPSQVPVVAFAISRSGTTSEVLMAVEHLHSHFLNVKTVGITCHSDKTLAHTAQRAICLDHASEESVVMTQSFTNMLLALQFIAAFVAKRDDLVAELSRLPAVLRHSLDGMIRFGQAVGGDTSLTQVIYLGLGSYYGLATEATLKLKEMTQTPCESYNPLEFRHGPISIVREGTAAVFLAMAEHASYIHDVVEDVKNVGGKTIVLAPETVAESLDGNMTLRLDDTFSDWARSILYMPALQSLAHARAVQLGLNPDQPRNLNQVVVLKSQS